MCGPPKDSGGQKCRKVRLRTDKGAWESSQNEKEILSRGTTGEDIRKRRPWGNTINRDRPYPFAFYLLGGKKGQILRRLSLVFLLRFPFIFVIFRPGSGNHDTI